MGEEFGNGHVASGRSRYPENSTIDELCVDSYMCLPFSLVFCFVISF